jgi:hypothetical protein
MPASNGDRPDTCSEQLLLNQLYELLNDNLRHFERFIEESMKSNTPLFQLTLSVRNDLLLYNHSKQEVIGMFRGLLE